ncbi:MAG TPA: ATP-binding cassette domain-containing protein, partial [Chitinophagales bacterium]|nr:ATP-binding cassette domain-containing protein [Chitinophagales bacterium]
MSVLLECCDIEKRYKLINTTGEQSTAWLQALNKVSFTLNEGDRLGLVGLNGSGKSTLLKILSGITKPTAGYVKLYKKVHNLSGFDSMLHTDMTGRQNIKFQLALMDYDTRQTNNAIEEITDFSG